MRCKKRSAALSPAALAGHGPTSSAHRGFTLMELLVVIGVLVVLAALLVPAVAMARKAAGQARCASNLRQWAQAATAYALQNDAFLPRRGQGKQPTQQLGWYDDWFNELPPFLGQSTYQNLVASNQMPQVGDGSVWICPQLAGTPNAYGNLFGYAMNMALSPRDAPQPDRITRVGPTSTLVFMADGPAGYCSTVPFVATPAALAPFNPAPRHNGQVNIAFLDGHVAPYPGGYLGVNAEGTPGNVAACDQPDVRWYWYVPGGPNSPWPGP